MASLQPVRGTHDLLPEAFRRHAHIVETARRISALYGFQPMATPIFEFTDVFSRTLGKTSDVVTKEMYSFDDRGGESLTLRPEGTAGIVRAVMSGGLQQDLPLKLAYSGPMFRYERPQKGRQRQFHQFGVELIGPDTPQADIEVIALGARILESLGLGDETVLELNTLGDAESRAAYRADLVIYFSDRIADLSADSRRRLERNPLRILDSKDEGDRRIVADAPVFDGYLNAASRDFFARVSEGVDAIGVTWRRNPRLVRGLDYYSHTAFEFTTSALGAQGTVLAGGRYDGLTEMMGGPRIPAVGWASGIERLALLAGDRAPAPARPVALIPIGAAAERCLLVLGEELRAAGLTGDMS